MIHKLRRTERAEEIAKVLGDYERWRSHGRAISRDILVSDPIRLKIEKIEEIHTFVLRLVVILGGLNVTCICTEIDMNCLYILGIPLTQ